MKKRIFLVSLLFILLLTIVPFKVSAATSTYKYYGYYLNYNTMKSNGDLQNISGFTSGFSVNNKNHSGYAIFFGHFAQANNKNYIMYCKDMGKFADKSLDKKNLTGNSNDGSIAGNTGISETKRKMLELLLSNGYHYDQADAALNFNSRTDRLSVIAMQLLVWEVMEGARTDWSHTGSNGDAYAPARPKSNNAYDKIIKPNGCPNAPSGKATSGTLCAIYRNIIDNIRSATSADTSTAFGKEYTMKWNNSLGKNGLYYVEVPGLGKYTTCSTSNTDMTVKVSGSKAIITTAKSVGSAVTINCSYMSGQGTSGTTKPFVVFEFTDGSLCSDGCQGFVYGGGTKTYKKSFTVRTEKSQVKVVKKNQATGAALDGTKFSLTMLNYAPGYTINLDGNGDSKNITGSGTYKVSETKTPTGFTPITDFKISFDLPSQSILSCDGGTKKTAHEYTCLNGQVSVKFTNNLITFTVLNTPKNFKIKKVDSTGKTGIKGATFQIKDKNGSLMKFKLTNGIFEYNTSGSVTNLKIDNSYSYPISLLPNGEYTVIETAVPSPYVMPSKESERTTKIKVSNGTLSVYDESQKKYVASSDASVTVKNYTTKVNVLKTGNGKSLQGVVFSLLKEDKTTYIKGTMTSAGVYNYAGEAAQPGENTNYVTNNKGYITVNNIPEGKYYFKEEQTVDPFQVPTGDAAYTEVTITVTKSGVKVNNKSQNTIAISNSANSFNFYKVDEDGNYLTSGKFKLQKWDDEKNRYVDIRVSSVQNDGTYDENADIFQPDDKGKVKFSLKNGIGTFINMPSSTKYRIIETDAPEGYVIGNASEGAEVTIDKFGNSAGLLMLTNQKISTETGDAKAELIINIATGQDRVPWALIIGGVILIIGGLISVVMYINKKGQK